VCLNDLQLAGLVKHVCLAANQPFGETEKAPPFGVRSPTRLPLPVLGRIR
jgi:hypothetical protein